MRCLLALLAACDGASVLPDSADEPDRILVYTRTNAFRHVDEIAIASFVLPARLYDLGVEADVTEDPQAFTESNLQRYRAVFFLYTSGNDILDVDGKAALESYVRGGGGWLGIHSAADTEYSWPFYAELVVSHFLTHPATQPANITIEASSHPTMAGVPSPWRFIDEWYDYRSNARAAAEVTILATVDESSYMGGGMGTDHPMIWCHERLGGRAFYSGIGHESDAWREPGFLTMIDNAVRWVIRRDAPDTARFR